MQRRRGAELESAILDAAWAELTEHGYASFTIDATARRAGTSKPVVYRRWADKQELVLAAVRKAGFDQVAEPPDTGSLRGDLVTLMRRANETRVWFAVFISVSFADFFKETGRTLAELRDLFLGDRAKLVDAVYDRAVARGEADPARLTPRIRALPFDLYRHDLLMTHQPMADETFEEIIDTIVLPLVAPVERSLR